MKISNKAYDILKYIVTIVLPALTTLWLALATIWNLPYGEPIGATMGAITVFLGALIGISSAQYNKEKENDNEQQ
jgi:hypothetical protein